MGLRGNVKQRARRQLPYAPVVEGRSRPPLQHQPDVLEVATGSADGRRHVHRSLLGRRRSVLDKAPLINCIPQGVVKLMGIFAMISTRDLYSPAIVLPGERFRRPDEGPADTLPLMLGSDRQGSQTGEIPGCVEQRE